MGSGPGAENAAAMEARLGGRAPSPPANDEGAGPPQSPDTRLFCAPAPLLLADKLSFTTFSQASANSGSSFRKCGTCQEGALVEVRWLLGSGDWAKVRIDQMYLNGIGGPQIRTAHLGLEILQMSHVQGAMTRYPKTASGGRDRGYSLTSKVTHVQDLVHCPASRVTASPDLAITQEVGLHEFAHG